MRWYYIVRFKKHIVLGLTLLVSYSSFAQLNVYNIQTITANQLVDQLVGSGVTWYNASFTGSSNGSSSGNFGLFSNGSSVIGISDGIVMSTGNVMGINHANWYSDYSWYNGGNSDADLNTISSPTYDVATLQFDFIPESDYIEFRYVFASEEYNEYVGSAYNDVFAFFITSLDVDGYSYNKKNIALIPFTATPVSINTVNNGSNSAYYIDNTSGVRTIEYDGLTRVLTAKVYVAPCKHYRMKLCLGDVGDQIYDSGVMLEANSFSSPVVNNATVTYSNLAMGGGTNMVEGCSNGIVQLFLNTPTPTNRTIPIVLSGTAVYGTDYTISPGTYTAPNMFYATVPAGQSSVTITIFPISDGLTEGSESVVMDIQTNVCPPASYLNGSSNILDDAMVFTITSVANPAGTVITNPADGTAWGKGGGTITVRNASWPMCTNWGITSILTNAINITNPVISTNLTYSAAAPTNLANGDICLTANTRMYYLNAAGTAWIDNYNVPVRLRISLRTPGGAAIPVESMTYLGNTYLMVKAQDINVNLYFEAYGPNDAMWGTVDAGGNNANYANTWAGILNVYNALHTNGSVTPAITNFTHGFYDINAGAIVSANTPVCLGDPINLFGSIGTCKSLSYQWIGPNSYTSSDQNPVINNSSTAMAGTYTFAGSGSVCYGINATTVSITTPSTTGLVGGDFYWSGRNTADWNANNNWLYFDGSAFSLPATVPASTNNVMIRSFSTCVHNEPTISSAQAYCKNLTVESPLTLTITNNQTLNSYGNWINNSIVTCVSETTVKFLGGSIQNIQGSSYTSFYNAQVNGSGVAANRDFSILGILTLTSGHFDLKDYEVSLETTGSVSGENINSRIRATNGAGTEGAGTGIIYIKCDNPSGNVAGLGLDFTPSSALGTDITIRRGCQALQGSGSYTGNYSIFRYYAINPVLGTSGISLNVNQFKYWGGASNPELNGHLENELQMFQRVQYWNGNTNPVFWEPRAGTVTIASDYVTSTTTSANQMLNYILITLGSTTKPLPVELNIFNGNCSSQGNYLFWQTSSETNNYGFWIERSDDALSWSSVAFVDGNGSTNSIHNYSYLYIRFSPISFYRLKQIDFNGNFSYSYIINVNCNEHNNEDIIPVYQEHGHIVFDIYGKAEKIYIVDIINILGQKLFSQMIYLNESNILLQPDILFSKGLYCVTLSSDNDIISNKSFVYN